MAVYVGLLYTCDDVHSDTQRTDGEVKGQVGLKGGWSRDWVQLGVTEGCR